jgi:hypothetical protein
MRGLALSRRLLQVGANSEPAVAVASLAVFRELMAAHRAEMRPLLQGVESSLQPQELDHEDDGEEHFRDDDAADAAASKADEEMALRYQPVVREPRFARAGHTPLWELYALAVHVHPSVAYGATRLLNCEAYRDVGDNPFEVFSSGELMEQFVLASRAHRGDNDKDKGKKSKVARVAFTSEHFSRKKHVPPHEKFFQMYFCDSTVRAAQQRKAQRKKQLEEDVDEEGAPDADDDIDEQEEDKFFDEYLKGQMPKDEGEDDDVDIDDDSEGADSEDALSDDAEEVESDGDAEVEGDDAESTSEDEPHRGRGKKRGADGPPSKKQRIKALKKKHGSSTFASMEDFEQLLAEDFS